MPSCCGDGQFCDFPWCDCDGNAEFRRKHKLEQPSDTEQDCGEQHCNYCRQVVRPRITAGVRVVDQQVKPPADADASPTEGGAMGREDRGEK